MKLKFALLILLLSSKTLFGQQENFRPAKVDFDAFESLTAEVKEHRKSRLIDLETFIKMAKEKGVLILDTRSDAMFKNKHIKGAVHLNFSDFTQENLARVIPSMDTKVLIYCNNNMDGDQKNFATKAVGPPFRSSLGRKGSPLKKGDILEDSEDTSELTLALNIPTYINLYGYGYRNVYELSELVSVFDRRVKFEGVAR